MSLRVRIDRETCIGAQTCVYTAPGAFEIDGQGLAVVADPDAAPDEQIRAAAISCPTGAIHLDDEGALAGEG